MNANRNISLVIAVTLLTAVVSRAQTYKFSIIGAHTNNGQVAKSLFKNPHGVAVNAAGDVLVADTGNGLIRMITPDGTTNTFTNLHQVVATTGLKPANPPAFHFHAPMGIAVDANNNIYVSDNNIIYEMSGTPSNALVTLVAGSTQGLQDGAAKAAKFNGAYGLATDSAGNIWVADQNNAQFREVTTNNLVITITPIRRMQNPHPPGPLPQDNHFTGLVIDHSDNVFLTDDTDYVSVYSPSNGLMTLWNGGNSTSSRGVAVDNADNVYIFDGTSNAVLSITPSGTATTLGTLPTKGHIAGVAVDVFRNIYLADQDNSVIIKGTPSYPAFFNGQVTLSGGVYYLAFPDDTTFGYYNLGDFDFPWFYHYDMGYEYFFDANDCKGGAYLYDLTSNSFWFTSPSLFPYVYDFTLNAWLYYFPDTQNPRHYTTNPRVFYDFGTSQIITR